MHDPASLMPAIPLSPDRVAATLALSLSKGERGAE